VGLRKHNRCKVKSAGLCSLLKCSLTTLHLPSSAQLQYFPLQAVSTIPHAPNPPEVISVMANKIEFSPAIPIPLVFDVQKRIQELRSYLDPNNPNYQPEQQHISIKAAIKLYEDEKIDGLQQVDIMEGKVVTQEEVFKGHAWAWGKVHSFKFLPSISTHVTNGAQITGNVSLVCSKVCLRSWAFWSLLSRSKGLGLYTGLGKGEDKEVVLQPFTATSDQAMVQRSCL
jgi:hypothetical protein